MSPGCLAIAGQSMDEDDAGSASMVSSVDRLTLGFHIRLQVPVT